MVVPISMKIGTNVKLSWAYHIRQENTNIYDFDLNYSTYITEHLKIVFFGNFRPKYDFRAWLWFLVNCSCFLLIFILLHRAVAEFCGVVVEFFSHFVDFQSCFGLISSGFCQCWFDLVEFGSIASHFCQLFADFCLFWQIVVWFWSFLAVFSPC